MAHMIDNSKGFNAFVAVGKPAWHGLGTVQQNLISAKDALEKSGADFTVLKLPNIHMLPNGNEIISENSFFTVRTDTNQILGDKFGKVYEVLQNIEVFNIVDEILQGGKATIETAGVIDNGKKVFICLKYQKSIIVGSTDKIDNYILLTTSHDGSIAITGTETPIRVVCNNTLTAALRGAKGAIKIRHTNTANDRLHEAMKVLKMLEDDTTILEDHFNKMAEIEISQNQMMDYFGTVFLAPDEIKELQTGKSLKQATTAQKIKMLTDVTTFAKVGTGQAETYKNGNPTIWTAYNAITGIYARKQYDNANDRANNLLFGSGARTLQTAGVLAAEPEKIQKMSKVNFNTNLN